MTSYQQFYVFTIWKDRKQKNQKQQNKRKKTKNKRKNSHWNNTKKTLMLDRVRMYFQSVLQKGHYHNTKDR